MTTLYDLHNEPEKLYGYEDAPYKVPAVAFRQAMRNPRVRDSKLEAAIIQDLEYAYMYAAFILNERWPEAEKYIMKDPKYAYYYARNILKRRWPEAEPVIMKDPKFAYSYALHILNGRWPEAEPVIMQNPHVWPKYKQHFNIK